MSQIISLLALASLSAFAGYLNYTMAWGLEVKSWGWLISTGIIAPVVLNSLMQAVMKE